MSAATGDAPHTGAQSKTSAPRHRADIQALRALAVVAVVLYHFGLTGTPGGFIGVDIFFVVSGYLVGGGLLRELQREHRIHWGPFWARRARRILPAGLAVIGTTLLASAAILSPLRMGFRSPDSVVNDAIAAVLYVPNLWFSAKGNDYLADTGRSPFLHYWSLGVEEQFYIAAPVILTALWFLARRQISWTILGVGVLTVASAFYGLALATTNPVSAFYVPGARAWELGAGMLIATAPPLAARYRIIARGVAWISVAVLTCAVLVVSSETAWPNATTVGVSLATAAALWAGSTPPTGKGSLPSRFVAGIGDRSYSIYLWHWPVLVLVPAALGRELDFLTGIAAATAIVVMSEVSYRFIETPLRRLSVSSTAHRQRIFTFAASASGAVLVLAVTLGLAVPRAILGSGPVATSTATADGQVLFAEAVPRDLRPSLETAKRGDVPQTYENGCHVQIDARSEPLDLCTYGETGPTLVLFGDSHAAQWLPTLMPLVDRGMVKVVSLTASWCTPMRAIEYPDDHFDGCEAWRQQALSYIEDNPPDLLVMSAFLSRAIAESDPDGAQLRESLDALYAELPDDLTTYWVADTAEFPWEPPECAAENAGSLSSCSVSRTQSRQSSLDDVASAVAQAHGADYVDLNDEICSPEHCGIVTGNVLIYRDDHHISGTFAASLANSLAESLGLEVVGDEPSASR